MKVNTPIGELPVRYGWNALRKISADTNMTMDDILNLNLMKESVDTILIFAYHGFTEGARFEKEECRVKDVEHLADMLDSNPEILASCIDVFKADMASKQADGDKKK